MKYFWGQNADIKGLADGKCKTCVSSVINTVYVALYQSDILNSSTLVWEKLCAINGSQLIHGVHSEPKVQSVASFSIIHF